MKTGTKIALGCAFAAVLTVIVVVSFGVFMARSAFRTEDVSQPQAEAAFGEIRRQFAGAKPAFEIKDNRPTVVVPPPATTTGPAPETLRILAWNANDGKLARINLPFKILLLGNDDIRFNNMSMPVEDVARYGRALLLDSDLPDGGHVVVWTD